MTLPELLALAPSLRILVVGDLMLDRTLHGTAERLSPEAPVPIIKGSHETLAPGGAANVAANLAGLGAQVDLCGILGRDEAGLLLAQRLQALKIALRGAGVINGPTTLKLRVKVGSQHLCRYDQEGDPADYGMRPEMFEALAPLLQDYDCLVISDYAKGLITQETYDLLIVLAQARNIAVVVDPKPRGGVAYHSAFLLTPNLAEARQLAGLGHGLIDTVAARVHEKLTPSHLLITRGHEGLALYSQQAPVAITGEGEGRTGAYETQRGYRALFSPAWAVPDRPDVTGAGDTVTALMALAVAAEVDLAEALPWANRAAAVVVGQPGTVVVTSPDLSGE